MARKALKLTRIHTFRPHIHSGSHTQVHILQDAICTMIGSTLSGRYKIVNVLGAGGMGRTYVAEDMLRPGHPKCVVKQLKPASTDPNVLDIARRLFATEAEILERLGNHDQIPRLLAYFEQDEEFYLVQEFIDGHPLSAELHQGQHWAESQVIELLRETLSVLTFIHNQNVIHRDIKPDNMIRRSRDNSMVLIDFGAVKQVRLQQLTQIGQASVTVAIGTPGYMPTEQSTGKPRPSSDIYAIGMVGIQALTGVLPTFLPEDEDGEVIWRPLVDVSDGFAEVLSKMVRHYFKHRYQSAAEALQALNQIKPTPRSAHPARLPSTQVAVGEHSFTPPPAPPTYPFQSFPPSSPSPSPQSLTTSQPNWVGSSPTPQPYIAPPSPYAPNSSSQPIAPTPPPQTPSTPPTQSVSPGRPQTSGIPHNQATDTQTVGNGHLTHYQFGSTTPFPGQSSDRTAPHSLPNGDSSPEHPATNRSFAKFLLGGSIALLLAGGAVYALFFARGQEPESVPQLTTPSPSPSPSPSPEPSPEPESNSAPVFEPESIPAPIPAPVPAPIPEPAPAPVPEEPAFETIPEPVAPEPEPDSSYSEPLPEPAPEPIAPEPEPDSSYSEPLPEPAPEPIAPEPATPAPSPAPAPVPNSDVPYFEVPDF